MKESKLDLFWHSYKYYPYERELARREINALVSPTSMADTSTGIRLTSPSFPDAAERLVYFSAFGDDTRPTLQARLESVNGSGKNRQSTRYSVHGLHEYKGKFNPQVPKAILNMLAVSSGSKVLDPFCGSGTSLVEATQLNINAFGTDINPLAVFLANSKIASLKVDIANLKAGAEEVVHFNSDYDLSDDSRNVYLRSWFEPEILGEIERVHNALKTLDSEVGTILSALASDLLRRYSLQDPIDLRIRRRKTPLPEKPFVKAFEEAVQLFTLRIESARKSLIEIGDSRAILLDSRDLSPLAIDGIGPFDYVITSPPYATALPYIDTQRLSLVWLGLIPPEDIHPLDARLVGSRESRGSERRKLSESLENNLEELPPEQFSYCLNLLNSVGEADGFRRKAVPALLYRYFAGMASSFRGVRSVVCKGAPYVLVVGGNHTTLGGKRFDIDTPAHLASLAEANGWITREILPLQTYQRYGYHMSNAVASEAMVILEAA